MSVEDFTTNVLALEFLKNSETSFDIHFIVPTMKKTRWRSRCQRVKFGLLVASAYTEIVATGRTFSTLCAAWRRGALSMSDQFHSLTEAYRQINVPADGLPYSEAFERLYRIVCKKTDSQLSRQEVWRLLCRLRKDGSLPRLRR